MSKTLAPSRTVTTRDRKGLKFISIVEAAYNKAGLSEDEAQRVNDTAGLAGLIGTFIADNRLTDRYKDEEVKSSYGYLSGYKKPKDVIAQTNLLRQLFPGVGFANEQMARPDVANAEGYFAIPRWQSIAPMYGEAVQKVLDALKKAYKGRFKNWREGELGPDQLRQSAKSVAFWEQIGEQQKGFDILLIPAQFGIRHRGRSVRRAREVMEQNECGLGAFAVGIMLLTHEDRLRHYDDLWIDCAGDEFHDPRNSDAPFDRAPIFSFNDDKLGFGTLWSGSADGNYGSASGWRIG
ncbi:MAG TPA: hypothetical protein VMU25_03000 [Candidatus Paceibacterota bacterium]|nr:hypothetical protein [Candidatus Paceibacterota bacterium]